jgi:hypothetical protein
MPAYTIAATAVTLGVSRKWLDNVLSHHTVPGVLQTRQGIVRRVTPEGLLNLELAARLNRDLSLPLGRALSAAAQLINAEGGEVALGDKPPLRIQVDLAALRRGLNTRLERALEITPSPRRGRPPTR